MATTQNVKMREYETIYILRSEVDGEAVEKVQTRVSDVIARESGKIVKVESWGRRRLAYPIGKQKKGVYVYVKYLGKGNLVAELERNLKITDDVVKFQTIQLREEVDVATVAIDPEEVKLALELASEAEEVETRERALGLVDLGPDAPRSRREDRDDMMDDDDDFDGDDLKKDDEL